MATPKGHLDYTDSPAVYCKIAGCSWWKDVTWDQFGDERSNPDWAALHPEHEPIDPRSATMMTVMLKINDSLNSAVEIRRAAPDDLRTGEDDVITYTVEVWQYAPQPRKVWEGALTHRYGNGLVYLAAQALTLVDEEAPRW